MKDVTPSAVLRNSLAMCGWAETKPGHQSAYVRKGARYLTWTLGDVMIATSPTTKFVDPERQVVLCGDGCGYEMTLEAIIVTPVKRGAGLAKEALRTWTRLAAEASLNLYLEPVPLESGINRERLIKLYASVGFESLDSDNRVMRAGRF